MIRDTEGEGAGERAETNVGTGIAGIAGIARSLVRGVGLSTVGYFAE